MKYNKEYLRVVLTWAIDKIKVLTKPLNKKDKIWKCNTEKYLYKI